MTTGEPRKIKSVDRTVDLLEEIRHAEGPLTVSELAEELDLAVSTVHTYLSTLEDRGLIRRADKGYQLGLKFIPLGHYVLHDLKLYKAGRDEIRKLANVTGEMSHLIVEHDGRLLPTYEWYGENASGMMFHEQKRERFLDHLHCTSCGKALLAYLPEEEVWDIIDQHDLKQMTPKTITDPDELFDELEAIHDRGFAICDEEQMPGQRAVGAAVRDKRGYPVGAISVSAPSKRLSGEQLRDRIPEKVRNTANVIEVNYRAFD